MTTLVFYLMIFFGVGVFFLFFHLMLGKLVPYGLIGIFETLAVVDRLGQPAPAA